MLQSVLSAPDSRPWRVDADGRRCAPCSPAGSTCRTSCSSPGVPLGSGSDYLDEVLAVRAAVEALVEDVLEDTGLMTPLTVEELMEDTLASIVLWLTA
ncbi:MAG: hypothetical protein F2840_10555 [Actinobacteria bacterium]|uniref:Unannotated protein n=1 Tax=freshwater metagenome TaxID=449393 RepID=A0A6J7KZG4_9ZZZZ|nr:hypothetical protein [Actinomycetota bacterium]